MTDIIDTSFFHGVMAAAQVMNRSHAGLRSAYADGITKFLIDALRSDHPIGGSERKLIADLLSGELGLGRGEKRGNPKRRAERELDRRITAKLAANRTSGVKRSLESVIEELVTQWNATPPPGGRVTVQQMVQYRGNPKDRK